MELREALIQISEIRDQVARTEVFRGYKSITVGLSGIVALLAAAAQALWIPDPEYQIVSYLILWITAAVFCVGVTAYLRTSPSTS